jgi:uncharacterized phage protein (TIGR02218 family)
MKTAPTPLKNFVAANNVGYRADLFTLTLLDGTVYRWTSADVGMTIGGHTWLSNGAVLSRGNLRWTSRLEVDNLDVMLSGATQINGKSICLLAATGFFDGARLQLDHIAGSDLPNAIANGPCLAYFEGLIAGIEPGPIVTKLIVQSDIAALGTVMLPQRTAELGCTYAVYDPNCTLNKATFTDAASVSNNSPTTTSVPSTTAAVIAKANGFYNLGMIVFTSGALNGVRRSVKSFSVSAGIGTIVPAIPFASAPAVADTFSIYPGCDRQQTTCNTKFSNLVNFSGFPHTPVPEASI